MTVREKISNALHFMLRMYVPTDDEFWVARQTLKADLAWQPYLYTAIFWGVLATIFFGDGDVMPIDRIDDTWMLFGTTSPIAAFTATVMLRLCRGQVRYSAFWLRIAANIGLIATIATYQLAVIQHPRPMTITIYFACVVFLFVLIVKDLRFLVTTERIARRLRT